MKTLDTSGRSHDDRAFDEFLEEARDQVEVRVFLCGKGINPKVPLAKLAARKADKRAYLWSRLEKEVSGCKVLLGEHDHLVAAYGQIFHKSSGKPRKINLASFEATLARHVHLIVVFPESAGSFAELGLFASPGGLPHKLFVIVEKHREKEKSFLNSFLARGPIASVATERGSVRYFDYKDIDGMFQAIKKTVDKIAEKLTTERIFIRRDL
jgi:hypothetical protein